MSSSTPGLAQIKLGRGSLSKTWLTWNGGCDTRGFLDPSAAKSWAGAQATKLGKEMGLSHLYLEGDAKLVVEAVN